MTGVHVSGNLPFVQTYRTDGLTALGDPTRRAIFERLADRPRAVGELAGELPISRPAVSQHLRVLLDAGLVTERRHGRERRYQLVPARLGPVRDWLAHYERFWDDRLQRLQKVLSKRSEA